MVVMYPVCEIINRYIPILSGKNDFKIKEKWNRNLMNCKTLKRRDLNWIILKTQKYW
jgi:hypothetical protein